MKETIFHQTVRYEYAKCAINAMREKECHSILEVGSGTHGNLAKYLPNDLITFLDINIPEEVLRDPRFVLGDVTNLPYSVGEYDFVIALDVLEHIPKEKRELCIENLHRVAKFGVILSVPHYCERDRYEDDLIKVFYMLCEKDPPVWIDEHIDCVLPKENELVSLIKKQGVEENYILTFYGVKRSLMMKMLIFEALASKYDKVLKFFDVMNSDYIRGILYQDINLNSEEAMKLYIVWSKEKSATELNRSISNTFISNRKVVDEFEKKYSELMEWVLSLELLNTCNQIYDDNEMRWNNVIKVYKEILYNLKTIQDIFGENQNKLNDLCYINKMTKESIKCAFDEIAKNNECSQRQITELESFIKEIWKICGSLLHQENIAMQNINSEISGINKKMEELTNVNEKNSVNVILITYNHSSFIRETLETVLSQETNFKFNILIADDCSTDNTIEIIKEMEKETDIPFVYLENDHNLGIMKNYHRAFKSCDAEFVAVMEGDDLWTDKLRLQKHVDFLKEHAECSMSFNRYVVKNFEEGTAVMQPRFSAEEEMHYYKYISGHDLAYNNLIGNFSTCVYRNSALKALPEEMFLIKCYDWLTNIMVSRIGYIGCLMQPMSIYRIHSKGVWSGQDPEEKIRSMIEAIDVYDAYTGREFTAGFSAHKQRLETALYGANIPVESKKKVVEPIKSILKKVCKFGDYIPPIFLSVVNLLVPKAIKNKIVSIL